jgi:hypothetical protein
MQLNHRHLTELDDLRLVYRGNQFMSDLFLQSTHSIRQITGSDSAAKGAYRFLNNERVSEDDLVLNMAANCRAAARGRLVVAIEDTTDINLSRHSGRLKQDDYLGGTHENVGKALGFMLHPCLVVDAERMIPYGYADVRLWSRDVKEGNCTQRDYKRQPLKHKESYKWVEVSQNAKDLLQDVVQGMVVVQDREGDIYEQFAKVPDQKTELLVRARGDRRLADGTMLFESCAAQPAAGIYTVTLGAKKGRKPREATMEIRYKRVRLKRPPSCLDKTVASEMVLYFIEAREKDYTGKDALLWHLVTSLEVSDVAVARLCIEWYSWRWMIEEVFRILKKDGYNIEACEMESAAAIRKLSLLILEVVIKLFLMRLAYSEPEEEFVAEACFNEEEQACLEAQITKLEGKTQKQKNPFPQKDLKRYVWLIARLGGWKGYESKRRPGITTLSIGLRRFNDSFQGWQLHRNVSTR